MKRTDFTKPQLKTLRENFTRLKAREASGEPIDQAPEAWARETFLAYSLKSEPDSAAFWHLLAINPKGRAYVYTMNDDGHYWFDWLSLAALEPLNRAARGAQSEIHPQLYLGEEGTPPWEV